MAIADTITSMQNHTSNAYTMIGYGTDLTGINKNLENLSSTIFEAFLEALRNPDTLFNNLPKTSGSGSNITLNNTANAPMRINLNPTAISQDGTPTPSSPQDIHTISGNNSVVVDNGNGLSQTNPINLGEYEIGTIGNYSNEFVRTSGKNKYNGNLVFNDQTTNGITLKNNSDGSFTITGTATASFSISAVADNSIERIKLPIGTYTQKLATRLQLYDSNWSWVANTYGTFTTTKEVYVASAWIELTNGRTYNDTYWYMLNEGTTALPYEPYGTNEWYYKQGIGKVVLDGTENWQSATSAMTGTNRFYYSNSSVINDKNVGSDIVYILSNKFKGIGWSSMYGTDTTTTNAISLYSNTQNVNRIQIRIDNTLASDTATFKTWLENNNTTCYYVLATPTYTKITGELAQELEQVYKGMLSYDGVTNISQINNDLSFNLGVSAITK